MKTEKGFTLLDLFIGVTISGALLAILSGFVLAPLGNSTAKMSAENYAKQVNAKGNVKLELDSCLAFDNDNDGTITCSFQRTPLRSPEPPSSVSLHCESGLMTRLVGGSCKPPRQFTVNDRAQGDW